MLDHFKMMVEEAVEKRCQERVEEVLKARYRETANRYYAKNRDKVVTKQRETAKKRREREIEQAVKKRLAEMSTTKTETPEGEAVKRPRSIDESLVVIG